jgi:sugar phosphate isomerase/epimerase
MNRRSFVAVGIAAIGGTRSASLAWAAEPRPFYAMDTGTKRVYPRNDISPAAQLDLLKELGYAGIAWTEEAPEAVRALRQEAEARGLTIFAIYCGATAHEEGALEVAPAVPGILEALSGHGTVIWLHIGGRGPKVEGLSAEAPVVQELRKLADAAQARGLAVAIYPHVGEWTERVADAVAVARLVDRPGFGVTFNLCHALAMGDGARLDALIKQAAPVLRAVTINGADAGVSGPDWKRLIQPLDRGSFDVGRLLATLDRVGYRGPIGLQSYGIGGEPRDNLSRSMAAWRRLQGGG